MSRLTADDRVRRLLSIVPWVAARHPEGVAIEELCERFDIDRKHLVADLTTLSYVGVYPYSPDAQVELVIEDGRVFIHLPQWFDRPLRLTPEQGLALVAAGQSLLAIPGAEAEGPLARGLKKIEAALGYRTDDAVDVHLGNAEPGIMGELRTAIDDHAQIEMTYYSWGRDEETRRVVDPYRLYADQGNWYLTAFCHVAEGDRVFRVDRIGDVERLATTFEPLTDPPSLGVFEPSADDPRVVLRLEPDSRWVLDQYPTESVEHLPSGQVVVTLAVTAPAWLERLLLRLGPDATVVEAPPEFDDMTARAARRILERYESPRVVQPTS
jgi:proteasome accessory factor C